MALLPQLQRQPKASFSPGNTMGQLFYTLSQERPRLDVGVFGPKAKCVYNEDADAHAEISVLVDKSKNNM